MESITTQLPQTTSLLSALKTANISLDFLTSYHGQSLMYRDPKSDQADFRMHKELGRLLANYLVIANQSIGVNYLPVDPVLINYSDHDQFKDDAYLLTGRLVFNLHQFIAQMDQSLVKKIAGQTIDHYCSHPRIIIRYKRLLKQLAENSLPNDIYVVNIQSTITEVTSDEELAEYRQAHNGLCPCQQESIVALSRDLDYVDKHPEAISTYINFADHVLITTTDHILPLADVKSGVHLAACPLCGRRL